MILIFMRFDRVIPSTTIMNKMCHAVIQNIQIAKQYNWLHYQTCFILCAFQFKRRN